MTDPNFQKYVEDADRIIKERGEILALGMTRKLSAEEVARFKDLAQQHEVAKACLEKSTAEIQ